jgi:hypothetical protein
VTHAAFIIPDTVVQAIICSPEERMDHMMFEAFVRRAATLLDRRTLFGGLSAALLAVGGIPHDASARKGK